MNTSKYFFIFPRLQGLLFPNPIWRPDRDVPRGTESLLFFSVGKTAIFQEKISFYINSF